MRSSIALCAMAALTSAAASAVAADAKKGKTPFSVRKTCHTIEADKNKIGPSLFAVVGRKAATVAKHKFSNSLKAAGAKSLVWTEENLMEHLKGPTRFPKAYLDAKSVSNKMKNRFRNKALRENNIAYLKTVK